MKKVSFKSLKGGKYNKRLSWESIRGIDCRIDFEQMPFFYILPKLGFRLESASKKLQYIVFGWLLWEISFYRDVYEHSLTSTDAGCKTTVTCCKNPRMLL